MTTGAKSQRCRIAARAGLGARSESGLSEGGALGAEWLGAYFEYDQPSDDLLDLRATVKLGEQLFLRLGQWKSDFNRGRIDSSGKQQMTERSISNYWSMFPWLLRRQRWYAFQDTHLRDGC